MSTTAGLNELRAEIAADWSRLVVELRREGASADAEQAMQYVAHIAQLVEADAPPSMATPCEIVFRIDPLTYPYRHTKGE